MAYFPFYMKADDMDFLVVGAGLVAYRKIEILLQFGACIRVVAPCQVVQIKNLADEGHVTLLERDFTFKDLQGAGAVIAATSDEKLNKEISETCRSMGIHVNVVDVKEQCSFIFPALIKDGNIVIGISTGGSSPAMAGLLKDCILKIMPEGAGDAAASLKMYRGYVKEKIDCQDVREKVFKGLTTEAIKAGGEISQEQVQDIIRRRLAEGNG